MFSSMDKRIKRNLEMKLLIGISIALLISNAYVAFLYVHEAKNNIELSLLYAMLIKDVLVGYR